MTSQGSLFSHTLRDITDTKLEDLANYRDEFESHRAATLQAVKEETNVVKALSVLADGVKECFKVDTVDGRILSGATDDRRLMIDLKNLDRFLAQARYDPSISHQILNQWHQRLMKCLNIQSLKYAFASLYGQLTKEWLTAEEGNQPDPNLDERMELEDFEHVETRRKLESRQTWQRLAFQPAKLDGDAITHALKSTFEPEGDDFFEQRKAIKRLREEVQSFQMTLTSTKSFDLTSLKWTIAGLKASELLSDEKRSVLRDIENNDTFLKEIADVLNMRKMALSTWSWGPQVQLDERRQVNGSFRVYMEEDLLQAIFLQHIGVKWSIFFKEQLCNLRGNSKVWKSGTLQNVEVEENFFREQLGESLDPEYGVQGLRERIHREDFFLTQLLDQVDQVCEVDEAMMEAEFATVDKKRAAPIVTPYMMSQAPPGTSARASGRGMGTGGAKRHRRIMPPRERPLLKQKKVANGNGAVSSEPDEDGKKNPMELRQNLVHMMATDIQVKARYHGEITCMRTQIEEFYPSLPHLSIKLILSYFGVSQRWLDFFMKFLAAPLRFVDDDGASPRQRLRGTPGAHVLSEVFGEVTLFCLDFYANKVAGGEVLWRVHDDLWFWSQNHQSCVDVWTGIQHFARTMGLSLNLDRSGCARIGRSTPANSKGEGFSALTCDPRLPEGDIRWGMLKLNHASGRWDIDREMVDKHVLELSRQLQSKENSIFAWIQTWNAYASTFFTANFGPPSICLGRTHVESMLETHKRIQQEVFRTSSPNGDRCSVAEILKERIGDRYKVVDIPDAYIFLPTELGGLDVHSPFIHLLHTLESFDRDIDQLFTEFEEAERNEYKLRKEAWDSSLENPQPHHGQMVKDKVPFMTFEQFASYHEAYSFGYDNELADVFVELLKAPEAHELECDSESEVWMALSALRGKFSRGLLPNWHDMEPYWQWVAQLYGPEMIEQFGGFRFVDPSWLPMGIVSQFRSGRVKWQD